MIPFLSPSPFGGVGGGSWVVRLWPMGRAIEYHWPGHCPPFVFWSKNKLIWIVLARKCAYYFISTKNCVLISLSDVYPEIISTKSPPNSHLISTTTRRIKLHGYQWRSSGDLVEIRWRCILCILLITKFLQAFRWEWRCIPTFRFKLYHYFYWR